MEVVGLADGVVIVGLAEGPDVDGLAVGERVGATELAGFEVVLTLGDVDFTGNPIGFVHT